MRVEKITAGQTQALRHAVLWPHKDPSFVLLEEDNCGFHFGAFDGNGMIRKEPVGVISVFQNQSDTSEFRFRKFAVSKDHQRRGIGTTLLNYTIQACKEMGGKKLWCDAREDAVKFYEKFGMRVGNNGKTFFKEDVPYVKLEMDL